MACFVVWQQLYQLNYGKKYGIAGYMGVTQKKICCSSAAVKLKLPSQIICIQTVILLVTLQL